MFWGLSWLRAALACMRSQTSVPACSKTTAEGRRIAREKAVQGPTIEEIAQAATKVGFACEPEDKAYPRDWLTRGRLRVALRDDTGKLCSPDVRSRKDVYIKIAEVMLCRSILLSFNFPAWVVFRTAGGGCRLASPATSSSGLSRRTTSPQAIRTSQDRVKRGGKPPVRPALVAPGSGRELLPHVPSAVRQ